MKVPLLDLDLQYEDIISEVKTAVNRVIDGKQFISGKEVGWFESLVSEAYGNVGSVGVSSGTDALLAALMALDIGMGDEVITTPYTFFATAGSIWRSGALPVFVDIEHDTFNIDASKIEAAITPRTKAIMPVHLFGQMADMGAIMKIAEKHGLHVIEDAAQAIGSRQRTGPLDTDMYAGTVGTCGCFSFFPSKNLGCAGDGGMVVSKDKSLAERIRIICKHGSEPKYYHSLVGGNFRLDTIQAAILCVKFGHLDYWSSRRRANAARYNQMLHDVPVEIPVLRGENISVYNQYVIRAPRRDELQSYLKDKGVGTAVYYPMSLHEQECFKILGYATGDFPESELAAKESLALPIFPELTRDQIEHVSHSIGDFYR